MLSFFTRRVNRKFIIKGLMTLALSVSFSSLSIASPTEVNLSAIENCHFLGKVEGSSGYGKNAGWQRLAKSSALRHAEKLGASHIVWERMTPIGVFNGIAVARTYSCNN